MPLDPPSKQRIWCWLALQDAGASLVRPQHPLLLFPGYNAPALHGTKSDVLITPLACLEMVHISSQTTPPPRIGLGTGLNLCTFMGSRWHSWNRCDSVDFFVHTYFNQLCKRNCTMKWLFCCKYKISPRHMCVHYHRPWRMSSSPWGKAEPMDNGQIETWLILPHCGSTHPVLYASY